jgi:tetratricopeptide (TPR) repeat protein
LEPGLFRAYHNRCWARVGTGDYDGAVADGTKAVEIDATFSQSFQYRGFALQAKGDYKGALADFGKALELDPKDATVYTLRAVVKRLTGDPKGALADATKAIELEPKDGSHYLSRGILQYDLRDWAGAMPDFRKALEAEGATRDDAQLRIYLLRVRQNESAAAKADLATYRKTRPPGIEDDVRDKVMAFLTGELVEKQLLEAPEAASPGQRCVALYYIGSIRLLAGNVAEAKRLLGLCLETRQQAFYEYRSAQAELDALPKEK